MFLYFQTCSAVCWKRCVVYMYKVGHVIENLNIFIDEIEIEMLYCSYIIMFVYCFNLIFIVW
jgi:hypothetical protein